METALGVVKKPSKTIAIVAFAVGILFSFIARAASIGNGFMPVIGGLILMFFDVAVFGVVPLLLILKKDDLAKTAFGFVFAYWLISRIYDNVGDATNIFKGMGNLWIATFVFDFLWGLALLVFAVLFVCYYVKKERVLLSAGFCVLFGSLPLALLAWILCVAAYAKGKANWQNYFSAISYYLAIPVAFSCAALFFSPIVAQKLSAVFSTKAAVPAEEAAAAEEEKPEPSED